MALFVSAEAFADYPTMLRDANLGALLSMFFSVPAMLLGKIMGVGTGDHTNMTANACATGLHKQP